VNDVPQLCIEGVSKRFQATVALEDVGFAVQRGEVHGLLGENGAGKTTLMKVLSGLVAPDAGRVRVGEVGLRPGRPESSRAAGIAMAYQELSSPPNVSVALKLCMPHLPRGWTGLVRAKEVIKRAQRILDDWELPDIDPWSRIEDISLAQRQYVELASAFALNPRVLILDEPTAALPDTDWLFRQIRRVTATGACAIYISHKLEEIRGICDRGTVLRSGRVAGAFSAGAMDPDALVQQMVGRRLVEAFPPKRAACGSPVPVLEVGGLAVKPGLAAADVRVGRGEVVGLAALEGQGQRELFYALAGRLRACAGRVRLHRDAGGGAAERPDFVLVPEERKTEGLFASMSCLSNLTISHLRQLRTLGCVRRGREKRFAAAAARDIHLPEALLPKNIGHLSGGNQQKVVLGRALLSRPRCLLLFDPTRGVDAATKIEIYKLVRRYADDGGAILLYSTEIPELVSLCDRVHSLYKGRVQAVHEGASLTEAAIMAAIIGHSTEEGSR
jgi:ribose transport system ATP-binding protein